MKTLSRRLVVSLIFSALAFAGVIPLLNVVATSVSAQVGRSFRMVPANGTAGAFVFVTMELNSQGDETGFTSSLNFNPNVLSISGVSGINTNPDVSLGSGAPAGSWITVNATQVASGRIGVFLSTPGPFVAGPRNALVFKFLVAQNAPAGVYPITFGDQPIGRSTSASGQGVPALYTDGTVTLTSQAAGFEGDINRSVSGTPGPGNGVVDNVDLFWYSEFAEGRHCPSDSTFNEFQRLDGNDSGGIDAGDYNYIFNVWLGLANPENPKGPTQRPAGLCDGVPTLPSESSFNLPNAQNMPLAPTSLKIMTASGLPGDTVLVPVHLEAQGVEISTGFSLSFDPNVLEITPTSGFNNPDVIKGTGGTATQRTGVNATSVANGRIGLGIDFAGGVSPATPIASGEKEIIVLRFKVKAGVPVGTQTAIEFTSSPVSPQTVSASGTIVPGVTFTAGTVTIGQANSPEVTVGGRVLTPNGRGLSATIILTDSGTGESKTVFSNAAGYYEFTGVASGKTYSVAATSKRFRFQPQTLTNLSSSLTEVNFTGVE